MSSSDLMISVRSLGKAYTIAHNRAEQATTLAEAALNRFKNPFAATTRETFWALKDVSFDIHRGDVVGVIGRNGAGKSTLLKVLSRITEPTTGAADLYGRVGSLLEVGTGFHAELTGRENIFLNGAILGMSRGEIRRQFDAIVDFAGVEKFLDTPVKRYSSGMYVRLAFAVAAHLRSEILIIDEVLAVGDAEFQNKCLGKMKELANEALRTVLFVSHNISAIQRLCNRAILLKQGSIVSDSSNVNAVLDDYTDGDLKNGSLDPVWQNRGGQFVGRTFQPTSFSLVDEEGIPLRGPMRNDCPGTVVIEGRISAEDPALNLGYAIYSSDGLLLYWSFIWDTVASPKTVKPGTIKCRSRLPRRLLNEGSYRIELIAGLHNREWICEPGRDAPSIVFRTFGGLSESALWISRRPGVMAPVLSWELNSG